MKNYKVSNYGVVFLCVLIFGTMSFTIGMDGSMPVELIVGIIIGLLVSILIALVRIFNTLNDKSQSKSEN